VEQDYALKIESLGYKYSNSITQHAVNPLNHNNNKPATPSHQGEFVCFFDGVCAVLYMYWHD